MSETNLISSDTDSGADAGSTPGSSGWTDDAEQASNINEANAETADAQEVATERVPTAESTPVVAPEQAAPEQAAPEQADGAAPEFAGAQAGLSAAAAVNGEPPRRRTGLSGMLLVELRQLATELNISEAADLRKGDLIAAIKQRQSGSSTAADQLSLPGSDPSGPASAEADLDDGPQPPTRRERREATEPKTEPGTRAEQGRDRRPERQGGGQGGQRSGQDRESRPARDRDNGNRDNRQDNRPDNRPDGRDDDDDGNGRGRRGRRFRDRRRGRDRERGPGGGGAEPEVREDDVLLPVAGILDVLDNYAFVRTSGYLSGPDDVYVSLAMVRRYGLRRGDALTGAVRQPREGEQQRQKFNPLVRVDTINGLDADAAKDRPEFTKLTPLYPNERLRLETESHMLTTRVIDLVMPIGKGQRALIVSPPKAGKTMVLQAIANAIATNNPECHLMADLLAGELIHVLDITNGARLETYVIEGKRGSGVVGINGAAARLIHTGDLVIVAAYAMMSDEEARDNKPTVVFVDEANRVVTVHSDPAI